MWNKIFKIFLFFIFSLSLLTSHLSPAFTQDRITLGVVPFQSPSKTAEMFIPLTEYLTKKTGIKVEFAVAKDFKVYQERIERGEYDMTFSNPFQYIVAKGKAGYTAFAKVGSEPFTGIILVRRDSDIKRIEDLKGKTIAFAYPTAWAAAVQTRKWLEDRYNIDYYKDMKPLFVISHDSAILAVYTKMVDAAGAIPHEFQTMDEHIKNDLNIIGETPPHPQMPFAYHPRVSQDVVLKIKNVLMSLDKTTSEGKKVLEALGRNGFESADDREYDVVRKLADEYSKEGLPYAKEFRWR